MRPQTFALDYDDTFDANPDMWYDLAHTMKAQGHSVIGVTLRNRGQLITDPRYNEVCWMVVYCAGQAKRPFLQEQNIHVDVWIDDKPEYITRTWEEIEGKPFEWPNGERPSDEHLSPLIVMNNFLDESNLNL